MNRIRSTRAALAIAVSLIGSSLSWPLVAATLYWTANGSQSTAWNTTDQNWTQTATGDGVAPGPADGSVYTDGGVDTVIFKRDMPAAGRTIAVRPAGVQPRWLRVDTSGNWDFSGGLINGPLTYYPNSGGGSQLRFNGYTTSMGFTAVTNGSFSSTIVWNFAGSPGAYRFCPAPIVNVGSYGAGFSFMPSPSGAAGVYEWQDDFELKSSGFTLKGGNGSGGRTNLFSGNILLNTTLTVQGDSTIMPRFSGTVTVSGDRSIYFSSSGEGIVDWADATFSGSASMLTFGTDNAQYRAQRLPSTGSRLGVQNLRLLNESWVIVNPTNAVEDYFAPLRSLGGKVTLAGFGSTSGGWLYLQTGSFRSSDIVATTSTTSTAVGCLVFDTTATNRNLTLDGTFAIDTNGPSRLYWRIASSGNGLVTGDLAVKGGHLVLHQPTSYASGTVRLAGNLRLTGGTIVERLLTSSARTIRLKLEGAPTLYLGDGDSGTIETITLRGNLINSGGPNEAWGFDADTVVDDGGMVLRYVGPAGQNSSDKYSFDWRNSSGTAQAFRGGSAGTIFELGNLPYNGGFVARGAGVTTFTGPVTVMNPYLLTFASNLPNNGVAPTRSEVLLTGTDAGMTVQHTGGRVAAASITVSSGAFLGGNGFYDAPVLVNEGAISPGASVGTMTVSNLTLNASSLLSFELPVKGVTGGGANDLLVVNGDLVLDGTLETPVRAGAGEYTIIQYSGSLTDNGLDVVNGRVVAGAGKVVVTFNEPGTVIVIR